MHLTNQITADKEQFIDFIKNYPSQTPVTMLNILKFKEKSGNVDDDGVHETGERAYNRYGKNVAPLLAKVGGQLVWAGKANQTLIGDYEEQPDRIIIVSYPSKEAFIEMTTSEAYQKIKHDREISLVYGGLIVTETLGG